MTVSVCGVSVDRHWDSVSDCLSLSVPVEAVACLCQAVPGAGLLESDPQDAGKEVFRKKAMKHSRNETRSHKKN